MKKVISRIFFLAVMLISGCTGSFSANPEGSLPATSTVEVKIIQPSADVIQTVKPTIPSTTDATIAIKITPSLAPKASTVPTLTPKERENATINLFLSNQGCALPCSWGFEPGVAKWEQIDDFLRQLGARISESDLGKDIQRFETASFRLDDNSISNQLSFYVEDGVVNSILIKGDGIHNIASFREIWKNYLLEAVLKTYGEPTQVLISINRGPFEEPANQINYDLWVTYDKLGFTIIYTGSIKNEPIIKLCPAAENGLGKSWSINLLLQAPDNPQSFENFFRKFGYLGDSNNLLSLEEAAGIKVHDFYRSFVNNRSSACFSFSRDK